MTDDPIDLDGHRGMAARNATEIRRERFHQFQEEQATLRRRREELIAHVTGDFARLCGREKGSSR